MESSRKHRMNGRSAAGAVVLVFACATAGRAQTLPVTDLLDRYVHGEFDAVVRDLESLSDFRPILKGLEDQGAAWIEADGSANRERRQLAAATFALEAARVDAWNEWKDRRSVPDYLAQACGPDGKTPRPPEVLAWKPPPLLIAWGSARFTRESKPGALERWWQLAAVSVAQRAEDFEFMRSDGVFCAYNPEVESRLPLSPATADSRMSRDSSWPKPSCRSSPRPANQGPLHVRTAAGGCGRRRRGHDAARCPAAPQ